MYLRFCHLMMGEARSHSFALLDNRGDLVALCPLGITEIEADGRKFNEASWNGAALAMPAIRPDLPSQRRRLAADVFDAFHEELGRHGVARSLLLKHPMSRAVLEGDARPAGQFEAMSAGYACQPQNTIVLDLSQSPEDLAKGMTQEQRKHLNQSQRRGLKVREFGAEDTELPQMHALYAQAHRQAAGRLTRPEASFDYMLQLAREGKLRLFAGFVNETPASFLYCGSHGPFRFGWSQANVEEHANEAATHQRRGTSSAAGMVPLRSQALRHLVEWSAVLSFQRSGARYYEIGRRFYGPQLHKVPTAKELSISFFKERYGGQLWPYLVFERFFDRELCRTFQQKRLQDYMDSFPFSLQPQTAEAS